MAISTRPVVRSRQGRAVRPILVLARTLLALSVTGVSYAGLAGAAFGPAAEPLGQEGLPAPKLAEASLSFAGVDPIITGSVAGLFDTPMFAGPNRAEKTDRIRQPGDPLAFARNFEAARTRLAALRAPQADPAALSQTRIAEAGSGADDAAGPRMSVAAIDPALARGALDAIDGIAPTFDMPSPAIPSEQLAYARANAPVTGGFARGDTMQVSDKERWCLSTAIYFEARGESYRGQVAVAQVVLNR